jgi:integrase
LRDHRRQQLELRLQLELGKSEPDALVFGNEDGTPMLPNNMTRRWQDVCISRGLPQVMFHALRDTHASALIAAGVDVVKISRRLGHADPTVTLRTYAHLFDKVDTTAATAIELALTQGAGAR